MVSADVAERGPEPDEPACAGVPLLQYAAVVAAEGDLVPLADVLDIEGLDDGEWRAARGGFSALLGSDARVFEQYCERLVEAQERLARRVIPLDEDLGAWAAWLALCQTRGPAMALSAHDLHPNDLLRLGRRWGSALDNPLLVKRSKHLAARAQEGRLELPPIHAGPMVLRPSSAARPRTCRDPDTLAAPGARPSSDMLACDLDTFARIDGALGVAPAERAAVFARYGLTLSVGDQVERAWRALIARDGGVRADFRALRAHHARTAHVAAGLAASSGPPAAGLAASSGPPAAGLAASSGPPVVAGTSTSSRAPAGPPSAASIAAAAAVLDSTAPYVVSLGEPLPFAAGVAGARPVAAHAAGRGGGLPFRAPVAHDLDTTAPHVVSLGEPLPFRAPESRELAGAGGPAEGRPAARSLVLRIPRRALEAEIVRSSGGSVDATTALVPSLLELSPLPFQPRRSARPTVEPRPASAAPVAAAAAPPGASQELTLAQYASLCAELALYPDHTSEVWRRYRIADATAAERIHRYWALRFLADPALEPTYWESHRQYFTWLRRSGGG